MYHVCVSSQCRRTAHDTCVFMSMSAFMCGISGENNNLCRTILYFGFLMLSVVRWWLDLILELHVSCVEKFCPFVIYLGPSQPFEE